MQFEVLVASNVVFKRVFFFTEMMMLLAAWTTHGKEENDVCLFVCSRGDTVFPHIVSEETIFSLICKILEISYSFYNNDYRISVNSFCGNYFF